MAINDIGLKILMVKKGQKINQSTMDEILQKRTRIFKFDVKTGQMIKQVMQNSGIDCMMKLDIHHGCMGTQNIAKCLYLLAENNISDFCLERLTLEEVFLKENEI